MGKSLINISFTRKLKFFLPTYETALPPSVLISWVLVSQCQPPRRVLIQTLKCKDSSAS